jgi:hypothetical protein
VKEPSSKKFKALLSELSKDESVRKAISDLKSSANAENIYYAQSVWDLLKQILKLSAKFLNKQKLKRLTEIIDIVMFLVSLSLILKQNIFDRPEVKQFFKEKWASLQSYSTAVMKVASDSINSTIARIKKSKGGRDEN